MTILERELCSSEDSSFINTAPVAHFAVIPDDGPNAPLITAFEHAYPSATIRQVSGNGPTAIIAERDASVAIYMCPRHSGWVVLKGSVYDVLADRLAEPEGVVAAFTTEAPDFGRFEGEFAAVIHDAKRGVTWCVNDHASLIHLYYGERAGKHYVTTAPIAVARAFGLGLDGAGVREFLGRGQVMCPNSLFAGMRRLSLGEHLRILKGRIQVGRHWSPYHEQRSYRNKRAAVETTVEVLMRVGRRYSCRGAVVSDLTGGYDSRLVASALSRAGAALTVTVNGHPQHPDVVIAQKVARAAGWPIRYFGPSESREVTAESARAAAYMSRGELDALGFHIHLATRPLLAKEHVVHVLGGGGELLRNFPWGQEFAGIGRRKPASVDRVLRYRLLSNPALPEHLFSTPFRSRLYDELRTRAMELMADGAGTRTTQQLDAIYLLRMTGHVSGYVSSLYDLLPTSAPLLQRTTIEHAVSLPWMMRLSSALLRRTIALLHPRAAAVATIYGGTAAPPRLTTLPIEAHQLLGRARHFVEKVDRVALKGTLGRIVPLALPGLAQAPLRIRMADFRTALQPVALRSRGVYRREPLAALLSDPSAWSTPAISRILTLEYVCKEIGAEPGPELLTD
jgi:hypothetical protein